MKQWLKLLITVGCVYVTSPTISYAMDEVQRDCKDPDTWYLADLSVVTIQPTPTQIISSVSKGFFLKLVDQFNLDPGLGYDTQYKKAIIINSRYGLKNGESYLVNFEENPSEGVAYVTSLEYVGSENGHTYIDSWDVQFGTGKVTRHRSSRNNHQYFFSTDIHEVVEQSRIATREFCLRMNEFVIIGNNVKVEGND